jgi:hypothetical protein
VSVASHVTPLHAQNEMPLEPVSRWTQQCAFGEIESVQVGVQT